MLFEHLDDSADFRREEYIIGIKEANYAAAACGESGIKSGILSAILFEHWDDTIAIACDDLSRVVR